MKKIKLNESSAIVIAIAINQLNANKKIANTAGKAVDSSKEVIRREIARLRQIDIDAMGEGETLIVDNGNQIGLKIDRRGKDLIDIAGLRAMHPEIAAKFTIRNVATYFEPIEPE